MLFAAEMQAFRACPPDSERDKLDAATETSLCVAATNAEFPDRYGFVRRSVAAGHRKPDADTGRLARLQESPAYVELERHFGRCGTLEFAGATREYGWSNTASGHPQTI
jgi:hypothetical protein